MGRNKLRGISKLVEDSVNARFAHYKHYPKEEILLVYDVRMLFVDSQNRFGHATKMAD